MKTIRNQRPSAITTMALFELCGALGCGFLLFLIPAGSRDWIALSVGALLGFVVVYGLWTLQFWAFWFTFCYEFLSIIYELFVLVQPGPRDVLHLFSPLVGMVLSTFTIGYIFLDRSIKPVFNRQR